MRRRLTFLLTITVAMLAATSAQAASDVGVDELLSDGAAFAGQTISVVGELIGDYGRRSDGSAWTQLNGDPYASAPLLESGALGGSNAGIGISAPADLIADLDPPGGYHQRGPLVRVSGIWEYHDADRGGETYLDAVSIEVLEPGRAIEEEVNPVVASLGALFLVTALWLALRGRKRLLD